jgi:hypothetical protein
MNNLAPPRGLPASLTDEDRSPADFSDEELAVLLALTAPIERARRNAFLAAVAGALAASPVRGAGVAHRIGREVQRAFYDAPRMTDYHDVQARAPRQGFAYPSTRRT